MADVKGLINDPDFQKLDPASQKQAVSRLDPDIGNLSDEDFGTFKQRMAAPLGDQPASLGGVASGMANQAGRALGAAWDTAKSIPGSLLRIANPATAAEDLTNAFRSNVDATGRARDAFSKGNYGEAAKSAVGAIPLIGPQAEQITRNATEGRLPEAIGQVGALALLPKAVPKVIEMAPRIAPAIMERMPASVAPLSSIGAGIKAAAPDIAGGSALAAGGAIGSEMLPGGPLKYAFGAAPAFAGGRMVVRGIGKGINAFREPPAEMGGIAATPATAPQKIVPPPRPGPPIQTASATPPAVMPPPRPGPPIRTAQETAPLGTGIREPQSEISSSPSTEPPEGITAEDWSKLKPNEQSAFLNSIQAAAARKASIRPPTSPVAIDTRSLVEPPSEPLNARIRPAQPPVIGQGVTPESPLGQGITISPENAQEIIDRMGHPDPLAETRHLGEGARARMQGLLGRAPSLEDPAIATKRAAQIARLAKSFPHETPAQWAERARQRPIR